MVARMTMPGSRRQDDAVPRAGSANRAGRFTRLLPVLIIALAALALFANTLPNGLVVDDERRYDQAIMHYEKTLVLQPDLAQAHNNLGVLYAKGGRTMDALPHFETATRLQPDNPSFRANLQRAQQESGTAEEPATAE